MNNFGLLISKLILGKIQVLISELFDKAFKKTPLPKGKTSRIEKCDEGYYVIVEEPYVLDQNL